jgi:AcrR family transcriptional regulator
VDRDVDESLVQATRAVVAERGVADVSLSAIAEAAGVSRVTLHRHGLTCDALLCAVADHAVEQYQRAMWPVLVGDAGPRERLEQALGVVCAQAEANLSLLRWLPADGHPHLHEAAAPRLRAALTDPLERIVRDGVEAGALRPIEPGEAATAIVAMVGGSYVNLRAEHRWPRERAERLCVELMLQGLAGGADGGGAERSPP